MGKKKEDEKHRECKTSGRMKKFLEPCLLLLLAQNSTYGYDLQEKIAKLGFDTPEPGSVYRCLRNLEESKKVTSTWETEGTGPARRAYEITPEGKELLDSWAERIERNQKILKRFLDAYENIQGK